jgi:hypothetical protein
MTGLAKITAIWDNREQLIDNFLKTGKFKVDDLVWARREDGPAMDRVKGIMQKLQTSAPEAPYPVRPSLYQKQDANAFALGGHAIQKAQNELLHARRAGKAPKELVSEVDSGFKDATLRRARRKMEEQAVWRQVNLPVTTTRIAGALPHLGPLPGPYFSWASSRPKAA